MSRYRMAIAILVFLGCQGGAVGGRASDPSPGIPDVPTEGAAPEDAVQEDPGTEGTTPIPDAAETIADVGEESHDTPAQDTAPQDSGAPKDVIPPPAQWVEIGLPFPKDFVFKGVWGSALDALFVVGAGPIAYRYDGQTFVDLEPTATMPVLNAVWGSGPEDVWMVGMGGTIIHYQGAATGPACTVDADCMAPDDCTKATCVSGNCAYAPMAKAGCCGFPSLTEGFDAGAPGFEFADLYAGQPNAGGVMWHVVSLNAPTTGIPRYTSPPNALYFGIPDKPCGYDPSFICQNFDNGLIVGATATSGPIPLPQAATITLRFNVLLDAEPSSSFDVLQVLVVKAGGGATEVWNKDAIGGTTNGGFVTTTADLTPFSGQTIRLRFLFDSSDNFDNSGEGAYIDDVVIESTCGSTTTKPPEFPTLYSVSGTGKDNVFAVGAQGAALRFDGKSWTQTGVKGPAKLRGICFDPGTGLWVVGDGGTVLHPDNGVFQKIPSSVKKDLAACGPGGIAVGYETLAKLDAANVSDIGGVGTAQLKAVSVLPDGQAWAVGIGGTAVQITNGVPTVLPTVAAGLNLYGVYAATSKKVWAVGDGGKIVRYNGTIWLSGDVVTNGKLFGIHGSGSDLILAVGEAGTAAVYKDYKWTPLPTGATVSLWGVHVLSPTEAWAVGNKGTLVHYLDGAFEVQAGPTSRDLYAITRDGDGRLWASGDGVVLRLDPEGWVVAFSTLDGDLRGVFALDPEHVYVAGKGATLERFDGKNWTLMKIEEIPQDDGSTVPFTGPLYGVWASAPDDVWAVSEAGAWVQCDGKTCALYGSGSKMTLRAVSGLRTDKTYGVWMVGGAGTVLHVGPSGLAEEVANPVASLYSVIAMKNGDVFAVGDTGTVLRRTQTKQ